MAEMVSYVAAGEIGIIKINNPPVNALSPGVPEGISDAVAKASADPGVRGIVLIGDGNTFIAGADIREFQKMTDGGNPRDLGIRPMLDALEGCSKPVVCAIHGTAFGGGLEVAMACHYRVAVRSARVGQPEVKLGLIPGAGGTQRLPRLAGIAKAIDMCTTGAPVGAADALSAGILDRIVEGNLEAEATAYARAAAAGPGPRRTRNLTDKLGNEAQNAPVFGAARELVRGRDRGLLAPLKAIDAIEAATKLDFNAGCALEAVLFMECLFSEQSRALIHIFFGERRCRRSRASPGTRPFSRSVPRQSSAQGRWEAASRWSTPVRAYR